MTEPPGSEPPDRQPDQGRRSQQEADGWAVLAVPLDSTPPGPIVTDEDSAEPGHSSPAWTPAGPPGGRIFSLEGRPAPGLYLVAWLFSLGGSAVLFMTLLASAEGIQPARAIGPILGLVGAGLLGVGLASGAGYQIVARSLRRGWETYRGPSPVLLFGVALIVAAIASVALSLIGLNPVGADPVGFVANLFAVEIAYALVVWLFVVRGGALRWADMGWPSKGPMVKVMGDLVIGLAVAVPTLFLVGAVAVVVSQLLGGVKAPDIVPSSRAATDVVLLAFATVLVAPVGEELFFRGLALTAWRRDLGSRSAIARSAVFFAAIHVINVQSVDFATGLRQVILVLVQILPLGLVLGWLFVRRGIVASIGAHAGYNAAIYLAALSLSNLPTV